MDDMRENRCRKRRREWIGIGLVLLALLAVLQGAAARSTGVQRRLALTELSDGWYYLTDGEKNWMTLPAVIRADVGGGPMTLYHDGIGGQYAGQVVTTRGAQYGLTILLDGEILYAYTELAGFPRNAQMKAKLDCDAALAAEEGLGEGTLALMLNPAEDGNYRFARVYVGEGEEVENSHYRRAAFMLAAAFIGVILGLIAAGISLYLRYKRMPDGRFTDAGLFFIICSLWYLTDSSLVQNRCARPELVCTVSFYLFMLLAVPMLHFLQKIGEIGKSRLLDIGIGLFYANAVIQGILNVLGVFEFIDMLFVTHLLLAVWVGISVALLIREYRRQPGREITMILGAFFVMGASGILALALYWLLEISYYGAIFACGTLVFLTLILADVIMTMTESVRERTELSVYQRMQREDWMTGLPNRQPFEEALAEIQRGAADCRDVLLIFLTVNDLRRTNEEYRRAAGDSLIVAAARCVETIFGKWGTCYRIGGDEFSVLIRNPETDAEEELFGRLDAEIEIFNRSGPGRYKMSMTCGSSRLRDADGNFKSVSSWKYEADERLYQNKRRGEDAENGI